MMTTFKYRKFALAMSLAALALAGCGGGSGSEDASNSADVTTKVSITTNAAGNTLADVNVNVNSLGAASGTDSWSTPAGRLIGVTLLAQLDSSGPDAWSAADHPLVYVTTDGPGYVGYLSTTQTAPGVSIIDGNTYAPVATATFTATGVAGYTEPHGVGVSPDGKWLYLQGNMPSSVSKLAGGGVLLVVNARTLKIDKIINSRVHHVRTIHDANLNKDLVLIDGWGTFFTLDPSDDNKVVGVVDPANLNGAGYLAFGDPAGKNLFISVRTGFADSNGGVAVVSLDNYKVKTRINTLDASPIWVAFSGTDADQYAYVSGGEDAIVTKIDISDANMAKWKVLGIANAGAIGPYGVTLNWDDKRLFTIGKGEASHNYGITDGIIDTSKFVDKNVYIGWNTVMGDIYTACLRGDHAIVHPDPAKNELWESCNSSFDTAVIGMGDSSAVTVQYGGGTGGAALLRNIPNPSGGSAHGGAFVKYDATWHGELLSDTNGLHGSAIQTKKDVLAGKISVGK